MEEKLEIFLSYAREDEAMFQKLKKHLRILQRQDLIDLWSDCSVDAGMERDREIYHHLNSAQIILLLISSDFLNSDHCYSTEMKTALERHARREAWVVPIMLRPVYFHRSPFADLQALPSGARPISQWRNRDDAFRDVTEGIAKIALQMNARQSISSSDPHGEEVLSLYLDDFLKQVIDSAREEARRSHRDYYGTPQLFLALTEIDKECMQVALFKLGFLPTQVSLAIRHALGVGKGTAGGPIMPTRRVQNMFKHLGQSELESLGTDKQRSLLAQAVLKTESPALQKILINLGLDPDQLWDAVSS